MKITLLHSPIDDPTMPYHATAYLKGHLFREGFADVDTRDINVEFVDFCLQESSIRYFYAALDARIEELESLPEISAVEQQQYLELKAAVRPDVAQLRAAVRTMRDPGAFTDFDRYRASVRALQAYFSCLGVLSYPAAIVDFRLTSRGNFSVQNLEDLFDRELGDRTCFSVKHYFEQVLRADAGLETSDLIGISIVYDHQLMPAVWLARAIKQRWPGKRVILGGTGISNYYKYLADKLLMKRFFEVCDVIVVGEGETAITEIAHAQGDPARLRQGKNTITYDAARDVLHLPQAIHHEDVSKLARPIYASPWDLYLSPARGINYSPTRGCYWNRCTFCDYGLNTDSPTSPWRERKLDQVMEDLAGAVRENAVGYVYFAVDVMAPGYLERLSDRILESGRIKRSAELRMEKIFSPERCRKMAEAGCVCVSFGMESGNQRILDLIDKGTKVQYMAETMKNFSDAGIAVQLMTFHGFPTETPAEKAETVQFVKENQAYWSTGGFGQFQLTANAIIAKKPQNFGIELIQIQGADAPRTYGYQLASAASAGCGGGATQPTPMRLNEELDASFHGSGGLFPAAYGRPWAGGTDTLHSMIYYRTHGRRIFRDYPLPGKSPAGVVPERPDALSKRRFLQVTGSLTLVPFDVQKMIAGRRRRTAFLQQLLRNNQEPTWRAMQEFSLRSPVVARDTPKPWLLSNTACMPLDPGASEWIRQCDTSLQPVDQLLGREPLDTKLRLEAYIERLSKSGLIQFGEQPRSSLEAVS